MKNRLAALPPAFLFWLAAAATAQDNKFTYTGQAVADDRAAELTLTIQEDSRVTGSMKIHASEKASGRLAGADLAFQGTANGDWEDENTTIEGSWNGVDHTGTEEKNNGTILIRIRKPGDVHNREVSVRLNGRRGKYTWAFPASGRVFRGKPAGKKKSRDDRENPLRNGTLKEPYVRYAVSGNAMDAWEKAKHQLPEPYALDQTEVCFFKSLLHLQVGETMSLGQGGGELVTVNTVTGETSPFQYTKLESEPLYAYGEPQDVLQISHVAHNQVNVAGLRKGIGKVILYQVWSMHDPVKKEDFRTRVNTVEVVVVHGKPEKPEAAGDDIPSVTVCGKAVRRTDKSPVEGATVRLVLAGGPNKGKAFDPQGKPTDKEGRFQVELKKVPSEEYEVLVQLLGVPGEDGVGPGNDLWPVKKYTVRLNKLLAEEGPVDVGTIEMDKVKDTDMTHRLPQQVTPKAAPPDAAGTAEQTDASGKTSDGGEAPPTSQGDPEPVAPKDQAVQDGWFRAPAGNLRFKVPEGWTARGQNTLVSPDGKLTLVCDGTSSPAQGDDADTALDMVANGMARDNPTAQKTELALGATPTILVAAYDAKARRMTWHLLAYNERRVYRWRVSMPAEAEMVTPPGAVLEILTSTVFER